MAEFTNPPLLTEAPTENTVPVFDADGNMVPTVIASIGSPLSVPQAPPGEVTQTSEDATVTTTEVVQTAPTAVSPYGYTQAQATAILTQQAATVVDLTDLKTQLNAAVADIAALVAENDALQTKLVAAGVLS